MRKGLPPIRRFARRLPPVLRTPARYGWSLVHGQWPAPLGFVVGRIKTRNPRTFREKMRYKMARDRREIVPIMLDKVRAKDYARSRAPGIPMPAVLTVGADSSAIDWQALPPEYVCKVTHASGGMVIVSHDASDDETLPPLDAMLDWGRYRIRPDSPEIARLPALMDAWVGRGYGWVPGSFVEWGYSKVPRRILVEQLVPTKQGQVSDVSVHCFDGEPRSVYAYRREADMSGIAAFRLLDGELDEVAARSHMTPETWEQIAEWSRALSRGHDVLRVDWLIDTAGNPWLGELTNYSGAAGPFYEGHPLHTPDEIDIIYGGYWTVPRRYR